MRHEQQSMPRAQEAADFKISFQIADAGIRRAFSVTIQATNKCTADVILRANWIAIEQLARLSLANSDRQEIRFEAG